MSKAISTSISLPPALAREVMQCARAEQRTKSGFVQEAIRYYIEQRRWKRVQRDTTGRAARLGLHSDDDLESLIDEIRS